MKGVFIMTKKEFMKALGNGSLEEALGLMFDAAEVRPAHGGYAVVIDRKRAFEVAQNKRSGLYKVCTHFATAQQADLVEVAECQTQQANYKFGDLDAEDMAAVTQLLYKAKKKIMAGKKEA